MRVTPLKNMNISYCSAQPASRKREERTERCKKFFIKNKTYLEAGAASLLIGGIFWAYHGGRRKFTGAVEGGFNTKLIDLFKGGMKLFPKDVQYRKELIKAAGGKEADYAALRPIVGGEEYKALIKEFSDSPEHYSPGASLITEVKDGYDMSGRISQKYRANLHVHTTHSDGRMSVTELLEQSAEYADKIAANINKNPEMKAKHAPFTIAITDHDTLEGCKEAVNIIKADPYKYRNLRVVLGCELTVEDKMLQRELKKPVGVHMLLHGINPYDEALNKFLDAKKAARAQLAADIIARSAEHVAKVNPLIASKLTYEDAKMICAPIDKGILHVDWLARDYVYYRVMFAELFEHNTEIKKMFTEKGINPDLIHYLTAREEYVNHVKFQENGREWERYKSLIHRFTAKLLGVKEEEAAAKMVLSPQTEKVFSEVSAIANAARPKLDLQPAYIDMKEFVTLFKQQEYGYMGIAHPGLTDIGKSLVHPEESVNSMLNLFKNFKAEGGERALCAELYYHYFGEVGKDKKWLDRISKYARAEGLMPSGGLDTHGRNIFYSDI